MVRNQNVLRICTDNLQKERGSPTKTTHISQGLAMIMHGALGSIQRGGNSMGIILPKITDESNDDYHNGPGISKSMLGVLAQSPAHYNHRFNMMESTPSTPAMEFGTAFHLSFLEPEKFGPQYVQAIGLNKNSNAYKEWRDEQQKAGLTIISEKDMETCLGMSESIRSHPFMSVLFRAGIAEQSHHWDCNGQHMRCRPDWTTIINGVNVFVDLKTTRSAHPDYIRSASWKLGYHLQAAIYVDGAKETTGKDFRFVFGFVEKTPPYVVTVAEATPEFVRKGRIEYLRLLDTLKECQQSGSWPGYTTDLINLEPPKWAIKEEYYDDE